MFYLYTYNQIFSFLLYHIFSVSIWHQTFCIVQFLIAVFFQYRSFSCWTEYTSRLLTKPTKWHVRPAKTQISLGIRPVWSEPSLSAWRQLGSLATHWAPSEDSDQTGRMPRLIWVFAGRTCHFVGFVTRRLVFEPICKTSGGSRGGWWGWGVARTPPPPAPWDQIFSWGILRQVGKIDQIEPPSANLNPLSKHPGSAPESSNWKVRKYFSFRWFYYYSLVQSASVSARGDNFYLRHLVTKSTYWHVRPAKTQISLGIHPVWLVFIALNG